MTPAIVIEPDGSHDTGICACCGHSSRRVWGYAYVGERCIAAYFVHWTVGHVLDQGANIDLILGDWGEEATDAQRGALALAYRLLETGPAMMVIDAETRPISRSSLVGRSWSRADALGTKDAEDAFAIADAILAQDSSVAELLGGWTVGA